MRRAAAFITALALALSLTACGGGGAGRQSAPVSGMTDRLPRVTVAV